MGADLAFPVAFGATIWVCLTLAHREPTTKLRLAIAAAVGLVTGVASFYLTGNPVETGLTAAGSALAIALLPPALAEYRRKARPEL